MSAPRPPSLSPPGSHSTDRFRFGALLGVLIFGAVLFAYSPALRGDFLWDDDGHVTRPDLQSLAGLGRIWTEIGATQQYYPLLHSAFWLQHQLWGDTPAGYHGVNVLLHATAACLFGLLLRRLQLRAAGLAALLFALHPVCVESVAWISEQKNTLSLVFYLAAALAYLRFDAERSARRYAFATVLFLAALLTKTVTASLPAALLVIAWWQRGQLDWRREVRPLLPWFALGAGSGLFTAHFEHQLIGAQGADFDLGVLDRLVLAGRVFWFYLGKLVWPVGLSFVYPRWTVDAAIAWQWIFTLAGLGLLAALTWWATRRSRGPLAVALLFGGSLFPVLGFVNVYPFVFSYVADHFQYLASLAIFAAAGACVDRLPRRVGLSVALALPLGLGALSWRQAAVYRDSQVLYTATLQRNPDAWLAHHNLAKILVEAGQVAAALPHLERTVALRPNYPEGLSNLGDGLTRLGRAPEALAPLERAVQLQPKYAEGHNNLGVALMALGRPEEGLTRFATAATLNPHFAAAHRNLGLAFANAGRPAEATPPLERAVALSPDDPDARMHLGTVLAMQGRYAEALPHFEIAVERAPASAEAQLRMALILRSLGRTAEANAYYREAVRLNPTLPSGTR